MNMLVSFLLFTLVANNVSAVDVVSFDQAMTQLVGKCKSAVLTDNDIELLASLYQKNNLSNVVQGADVKIPKIIHQIWLGSPFPDAYKKLQETWQKLHPDWEYWLWTDVDAESFDMVNRLAFEKAKNYGQKADIFRYEILYQYGGLYVDVDFECLKPFDVLNHAYDFYTGIIQTRKLNNALIGSVPGHPILKLCIDSMQASDLEPNDVWGIIGQTGPIHFTKSFMAYLNSLTVLPNACIAFPITFFYPVPNHAGVNKILNKDKAKKYIKPESFAVHYWEGSWVSKRSLSDVP